YSYSLYFYFHDSLRALHSFPTRRSSDLAAALLQIAAFFQFFDGLQVVASGALRGVGDTRTPLWSHLTGYWLIGLPLGAWLCFREDRKSTRLNSSHSQISYAVFCLKKKILLSPPSSLMPQSRHRRVSGR